MLGRLTFQLTPDIIRLHRLTFSYYSHKHRRISNTRTTTKKQILITKRNDITTLLGMDWMKNFKITIGNIRVQDSNQSKKRQIFEKFPDLFKKNTTTKDTEINLQLKPKTGTLCGETRSMTDPTTPTRRRRETPGETNKNRKLVESETCI